MKKIVRSFAIEPDLSDWLDSFPARRASRVVCRALKAMRDQLDDVELVLIRGIPGSGKSTLAKERFPEHKHIEADMYFMHGQEYMFQAENLGKAHSWCRAMAESYLESGESVVVANTFTTREEMAPYHKMAREIGCGIKVVTAPFNNNPFPSVHGVPSETIAKMKERWED